MKKIVSILLVVMMLVSMIPATVFAADAETAELSLSKQTYLISKTANQQVYANNNVTLTYNKGTYNQALRDNTGDTHLRLYVGTNFTVEYPANITQIKFNCVSNYLGNLASDIEGAAVTTSGTTITAVLSTPATSFTVSNITKQTRVNSITVTYEVGGSSEPETPACTHESTVESGYVAPGCTTTGMSATVTCTACGEVVTAGEEIPATGHSYVDGACSVCGKEETATATATLSFADAANRTTSTTTQQIWEQNSVKMTYEKGSYNNNLAEYQNPIRIYANTKVTVEFPMNMTQIVFNCASESYATALANSIGSSATANGSDVTAVLATPATSFEIAAISAQTRVNSLTVTYEVNEEICLHEETTTEGYVAPTCTTEGATGATVCVACGEIVKESEALPISHGDNETYTEGYTAPGCETEGATGTVKCSNCDAVINESTAIAATGHNYVDGVCENCGAAEPSAPETPTGYVLVTDVAEITAGGQFVIVANTGSAYQALITSISSKIYPEAVTVVDGVVTTENPPVWQIQAVSGGIALYNGSNYLTYSSSTNLGSSATPYTWTVEAASEGTFYITSATTTDRGLIYQAGTGNRYGGYKITNRTATDYVGGLELYKLVEEEVDPNACTHELTETTAGYPATCTADGKEDTLSCACGQNVQEGAVIPSPGHSYDDDYCTICKIINPEAAKQAEAIDGMAAAGDKVIFYHPSSKVAMSATTVETTKGIRMDAVSVTKASGLIPYSATHTAVMTVEQVGEYYRFEMGGQYLTSGADGNTLNFAALPAEGETDYTLWDVTEDSSYGVFIRSVNATYNGTDYNQSIEYYQGAFYPYGFNGTDYITSYRIQLGLVNKVTLTENVDGLTVEGNLYLDLNGFAATNVAADQLVVWDSSATATTAGTGSLTTTAEVAVDNTVEGVRYIALKDAEGVYTFHTLDVKLTNVTLRTNKAGIYYKAEMACDEVLKAAIKSHGIAVSIMGMPTADFENEENTAATKISGAPESVFTSGSITNIFRAGLSAEKNAARGEMVIYANPYIKLADGTVLMGNNNAQKSLKDVMDYLNTNYATLEAADQENALSFYETWADAMATWELTNLAAAIAPGTEEAA